MQLGSGRNYLYLNNNNFVMKRNDCVVRLPMQRISDKEMVYFNRTTTIEGMTENAANDMHNNRQANKIKF